MSDKAHLDVLHDETTTDLVKKLIGEFIKLVRDPETTTTSYSVKLRALLDEPLQDADDVARGTDCQKFRGFRSKGEAIRLDRDLALFFGPNGFGKTSLVEAIECLFYGFTKRRRPGDGHSKAEYAGTYTNVHRGKPVQVDFNVVIVKKNICSPVA